jgi:hypothetical protein
MPVRPQKSAPSLTRAPRNGAISFALSTGIRSRNCSKREKSTDTRRPKNENCAHGLEKVRNKLCRQTYATQHVGMSSTSTWTVPPPSAESFPRALRWVPNYKHRKELSQLAGRSSLNLFGGQMLDACMRADSPAPVRGLRGRGRLRDPGFRSYLAPSRLRRDYSPPPPSGAAPEMSRGIVRTHCLSFGFSDLEHWNLFRISCFEFRIWFRLCHAGLSCRGPSGQNVET